MRIFTAALLGASLMGLTACGKADTNKAVDAAKAEAEAMANKAKDKAADTMNDVKEKAKEMTPSTSAIEAERWLKANGARPDVITLPSGLQYSVNTPSQSPL